MITEMPMKRSNMYLVPDAEKSYVAPRIEFLSWAADVVDVSIFRHIGAYPNTEKGMRLAKLHLAIISGLCPNVPKAPHWRRISPRESTLIFRKWVDDYDLDS